MEEDKPVLVHENCRKGFVDSRKRKAPKREPNLNGKRLRSSNDNTQFDWNSLCAKRANVNLSTVSPVETMSVVEKVVERCVERGDDWGSDVHSRIALCQPAVMKSGIYHIACMTSFLLNVTTGKKKGRPVDTSKQENFESVCTWLETEGGESFTLA